MRQLLLAVVVFSVYSVSATTADPLQAGSPAVGDCKSRKDVAGECYRVRGRLRAYSSPPRCRIWPVGTTKLLAVSERNALPANVACGDDFEVYADFLVCPLRQSFPSAMQSVCVVSAMNLRASEIKHNLGEKP